MNKKLLIIAMSLSAFSLIGCGTTDTRYAKDPVIAIEIPENQIEGADVGNAEGLRSSIESAGRVELSEELQEPVNVQPTANDVPMEIISEPQNLQFYFATNAHELQTDDIAELSQHARYLVAHPDMKLKITGHADQSGDFDYNQRLAMKRADYVARLLVQQGVLPDQITIYSEGEALAMTGLEHAIRDRRVDFEYHSEMQLTEKQVY